MSFEAEKAKDLHYHQADAEVMSDPRNWPKRNEIQALKSPDISTHNNVDKNQDTEDTNQEDID